MSELVYTLIRKKSRKRVAIAVLPCGSVQVLAPIRASVSRIKGFLRDKSDWIRKQQLVCHAREQAPILTGNSGDMLLYFGREITLQVLPGVKRSVGLVGSELVVGMREPDPEKVKKMVLKWYRELAQEIIEDRVLIWSAHLSKKPKQVRLKTMTSRWGSCSILGNLNFNWKLIMAPLDVLDYVVVHELSHLVHHDHSRKFWDFVALLMPDFKRHVVWLRENGYRLAL
ncbi:MAG: M48 family peptidase [Candidatus Margulisbacteria bacterium]|nr:M48 family peptidase [Candidatus Margulisiibacteriota bacterium]